MFTKKFAKRTVERAIKTGAQFIAFHLTAAFTVVTADNMPAVNAWLTDWKTVSGSFLGGAFFSVVTSLASSKISGEPDDPSVVP